MKLDIPFNYTDLKQVDIGLTNHNYLIKIDDKQYIVRVPRSDLSHLFNRNQEQEVLRKLEGQTFTLDPLYYNDGIQIVRYQDSLINFDQYQNPDKIERVAALMKSFHNSNVKVDFDFDPIKQIDAYLKYSDDLDIDIEDYRFVIDRLKEHKFTPTLCHNDWVEGNICYLNEKTYLIDFEYAGNNDKRFDIMSFITENDLTNNEKKDFIELMYPDGLDAIEEQLLCMYRDINNLLWYLWAKMMYTVRKESVYKDISKIKLKQLTEEYRKPLNFL